MNASTCYSMPLIIFSLFFTKNISGDELTADQAPTVNGLSLFKQGIRPEWEDKSNLFGGELICRLSLKQMNDLDYCWEILIIALIGESIDSGDEICGCRIVNKSNKGNILFKFEVWLRSQDPVKSKEIERKLMEALSPAPPEIRKEFIFTFVTER